MLSFLNQYAKFSLMFDSTFWEIASLCCYCATGAFNFSVYPLPQGSIAFSAYSFFYSMLFLLHDEVTSIKPKISTYYFLLLPSLFCSLLSFFLIFLCVTIYVSYKFLSCFCFFPSNSWWFFVDHLCLGDELKSYGRRVCLLEDFIEERSNKGPAVFLGT